MADGAQPRLPFVGAAARASLPTRGRRPSAAAGARDIRPSTLRLVGRHQLAALAATAVDFVFMAALVELLRLAPPLAAGLGAAVGALVNFLLNRRWVFTAERSPVQTQVVRYAWVSCASAVWNALGEHLLLKLLGAHYLLVRAVVSAAVSLGWNFPMQRRWVFRVAPEQS